MQQISNTAGRFAGSTILLRDMDGREMDLIRGKLGMTKVEFLKELGISRMHLYRCLRDGPPRLVALAVLGLWYSRKMDGLLEEPKQPPEAKPRAKRRQKKR
jgi:hypothetical protein